MENRVIFGGFVWIAAAALGAQTPATGASRAQEKKKPAVSETVVVSATRTEQPVSDVPASVTVLPAEQIRAIPSLAPDELLRNVPGVQLPLGSSVTIYPSNNQVSMRGLGGNRALVMIDGIPILEPFSGFVEWLKVPEAELDRIEVTRGSQSSLFGNSAMGGTIDLVTKAARTTRLDASASAGSLTTRQADARGAWAVTPDFGISLTGQAFDTNGYQRVPEDQRGAVDIPSGLKSESLSLRAELHPDEGLNGFLRASVFDADQGQGTPLSNDHLHIGDLAASTNAQLWGGTLSGSAYAQFSKLDVVNSLLSSDRSSERLSNTPTTPARDLGGSLQWTTAAGANVPTLTVGLDVRNPSGETRRTDFSASGAPVAFSKASGQQLFGGVFAAAEWDPAANVAVFASARLDWWRNFDGRQSSTSPPSSVSYEARETTRLDPRVGVLWRLSPSLAVRAAGYRGFHAPYLADLYRSTLTRSFQALANPELGPESMTGAETGISWSRGGFGAEVNGFYDRVDDLISRVVLATSPVLTQTAENVGRARSTGAELIASAPVTGWLAVRAAATYTDARIVDDPANRSLEGKAVPLVPRKFASLGIDAHPVPTVLLSAQLRTMSRQYGDPANTLAEDAVTLLDASASWAVLPSLDLFVTGQNLLGRSYVSEVTIGRRLGTPRVLMAGIRIRVAPGEPGS